MLYATPPLGRDEQRVLALIEGLRQDLQLYLHEPRRWTGSLRRLAIARNVQGSNSIEGYDSSLDDAAAVALGEEPLDASAETARALAGYREAMTYVLQMAEDEELLSEPLLKSLHFMMTSYSLANRPGRWRTGAVYVRRDSDGAIVHEGADADKVPALMAELVESTRSQDADASPALVRAAMAHLNLVLIHPFKDGNGRMARVVQSLLLAKDGSSSPVFASIEEYLGRNTQAYYDALAEVGGGSWDPTRDATAWVRFALTAHYRQAGTTLDRIKESERLWIELDQLRMSRGLPERVVYALYDAAFGFRVRNSVYRAVLEASGEPIALQTATHDLKRLVEAGLLDTRGERRGRHYVASPELAALRQQIRAARPRRDQSDPFAS